MISRFASALLVAFAASGALAQTRTRQEEITFNRAVEAIRTFQKAWERSWLSGMRVRHARMNRLAPGLVGSPPDVDPRTYEVNCYWNMDSVQIYVPFHAWGLDTKERRIASKVDRHYWACPNWLPPKDFYLTGPGLPDERLSIDNALEPSARQKIRDERAKLIAELARAFARMPHDSVVAGQYIHFLIENDELPAAMVALDACRVPGSWCPALRGFVNHKLGQMFDAEDAYLIALDSLTDEARCATTNIAVLLDDNARDGYHKLPCEQQDAINQKVWWLADPLWSVPGNDRFVEQRSRKVLIALRGGTGRDERYNWAPYGGGDALTELVERYGWPSYTHGPRPIRWAPVLKDIYSRYPKDTAERRIARALGGWRTTFEYSIGRVHVIPPMSMVDDPFSIRNEDWSMNAPGGEWDFTFNWWPVEHYAPHHPLTKLVDQQTAFLRRQDTTLLAFATNLARTDLARKLGDSVTGVFMTSTGPRAIRRVDERRVGAQGRLTFLAALPAGPSLVSVEVPPLADGERGARSRFGVKPPPPLSAMAPGEAAISDPIILAVPPNVTALPTLADSAIALMNGSTTLAAGTSSLGVFWETYGIAAGDSIEIILTLQARRGGPPVTTSWREPQPGRSVRNVAGAVSIQMRSVILDVSAIPVGVYDITISVRRANGQVLRSSREISVR